MAQLAKTLVRDNGLDEVIEVIQGSAESVELPQKVTLGSVEAIPSSLVPRQSRCSL